MAFATATDAQILAAYKQADKLQRMLQEYAQGDASQTVKPRKGRFPVATIQTQVAALNTALVPLTA